MANSIVREFKKRIEELLASNKATLLSGEDSTKAIQFIEAIAFGHAELNKLTPPIFVFLSKPDGGLAVSIENTGTRVYQDTDTDATFLAQVGLDHGFCMIWDSRDFYIALRFETEGVNRG